MRPLTASDAFGKLDREATDRWHTLVDHMADVAATFEVLCTCRAIRRALDEAAGRSLECLDIARLTALAFLHDLGKANTGFQAKRWPSGARPSHRLTAGHSAEAMALLDAACSGSDEAWALLTRLPVEQMANDWGDEAVVTLLHASIAHHGRPIHAAQPWSRARVHWHPQDSYDPGAQLQRVSAALQAFLPNAFKPGGAPLPSAPRFVHLFAGLVQLADWLGSDTRHFPFSEPGEDRLITSRERAHDAVAGLGLDAEDFRADLKATSPSFSDVFGGTAPYPTQSAMADDTLGPVVVLEAETGSGKTEAALWRFLHLFKQGKVDSLYFALPTRVAASQAYARVRQAIVRTWPNGGPMVLRALAGYAAADGQTPHALPDFKVLWSDEPNDAEAGRRWAGESAKRFLAAPVAVGTVDQALLGTLQVKHAHLRHALAARALLVVDEVHASDAHMGVLIEHLIASQVALGGHVLLLSATLGAAARIRYLGAGRPQPFQAIPLHRASTLPYPAISDPSGLRATRGAQREKPVHWRSQDCIDDPARIAALAIDAAKQGARVLIIRNTVPAAIATLSALESAAPNPDWLFRIGTTATLHHSRFSREDRPRLDAAVEAQLGKHRPAGPLIVVGTQTLEQSLDLDADFLITDLCPMDVLLQRIGRLHRHARPDDARPAAYRTAQTCVVTPTDGDLTPNLKRPRHGLGLFHNGGGVYADVRILQATLNLIDAEPQVCIPADNRRLVESATHPEALRIVESRDERWASHGQQIDGLTGAKKTNARLGLLPFDRPFEELSFPDDIKLATRLGAADRVANFMPPQPGPFDMPVAELPIRFHLLPPGLPEDAAPEDIVAEAGGFTFCFGNARYRYSRFGLERLPDTTPGE